MKESLHIIPAILEKDLTAISTKMKKVSGLVDMVQVDICDGQFVPATTYASTGTDRSMSAIVRHAKKNKLALGLDMMVDLDCGDCMDTWVDVLMAHKPERVIFHLGSTYRWDDLFIMIEKKSRGGKIPFECGLAVRLDHTRREIGKVFDEHPFGFIQVMGIEKVGYSGQKFSQRTYERVKKIRRSYPHIGVAIDGGVKLANAQCLLDAGATRLGVNSGIYKTKNIAATIDQFKNLNI